jgi:hypothetical protein
MSSAFTIRAMSNAPFPGVPRVDLAGAPAAGQTAVEYVVRVRDDDGRPIAGADVTLVATVRDSGVLTAPLEPTGTDGTYQGRLDTDGREPREVRVRIAVEGKRFEIPLVR